MHTGVPAYPGVAFDKDVALLLSEIDPVQNQAVADAVDKAGFSEVATYSRRLANSVNSILVGSGGAGYASSPGVTVGAPPCTPNGTTCVQALASAMVDSGKVTAITLDNPGAGYRSSPNVTVAAPPCTPNGTTCVQATATSGLLLASTTACIAADRRRWPRAIRPRSTTARSTT